MPKEAYSPVWKVLLLSIITIFIYLLYWAVTRKRFLNKKGADIPTAWLIIIPIVNWYFYYRLCRGWARVCRQDSSAKWLAFALWLLIPFVAAAFMQDEINNRFYKRI